MVKKSKLAVPQTKCPTCGRPPPFDRTAYMKEYMAERRRKEKLEKARK